MATINPSYAGQAYGTNSNSTHASYTGVYYDAGHTHTSPLPAHTHTLTVPTSGVNWGYVQTSSSGNNQFTTTLSSRGIDPWDVLEMATMPWVNAKISEGLVSQALWAVENGQSII